MGTTFASCQSFGVTPESSDCWKMNVSIPASSLAADCKKHAGMLSGSVAFLGLSRSSRVFFTPAVVTVFLAYLGMVSS